MKRKHVVAGIAGGSVGVALLSLSPRAEAATLEVGPAMTYATPCDAIAVAQPNDTIEIAPGTYTDSCPISVAGLTLKGVGGRPVIDLSGTNHPSGFKGIYVIDADNVTIENLELMGAHVDDVNNANAAALRVTGHGLVVRSCYLHDNQNGILAAPVVDGGTLTVEHSELAHNGLGNGCNVGGCTHNIYISTTTTGRYDKLVFQYNWSHDIANDTADKGHLFKSRARESDVLYNRISGENGHDSYGVDLPSGGLGIIVGNVIQKGPMGDNKTLLAYGEEGISNPDMRLFVANNTFVNDFGSGTFIDVTGGETLVAHNNLFIGMGTMSTTGALSADNLATATPMFVDAAMYDYHLMGGSPALNVGVDPGSADAFSLVPTEEYVHPLANVPRLSDGMLDLGAFELGTNTNVGGAGSTGATGATSSNGANGSNGASGTASSASGQATSGSGGAGNGADSSSGCGCTLAPSDDTFPEGLVAIALFGAFFGGVAGRRARRYSRV